MHQKTSQKQSTAFALLFLLQHYYTWGFQETVPFSQSKIRPKRNHLRVVSTHLNSKKYRLDDEGGDDEVLERINVFDAKFQRAFGSEEVPEDQRPANEYLNLISSPLFEWADRPDGGKALLLRLTVLYLICFGAVCWPISNATFTEVDGYTFHKIFSSNIGALGLVLLLLIRLYSGWGYVASRLQSDKIEFEETGWYDGDIQEKTSSEKARDLMLYRANVQPVQERLKKFTLTAGALWVASCIGLNVIFQIKPMFDEYDAGMLNSLRYDDKIANVAAEQSNGRPTYCDSRYYRAIANGGQGCK